MITAPRRALAAALAGAAAAAIAITATPSSTTPPPAQPPAASTGHGPAQLMYDYEAIRRAADELARKTSPASPPDSSTNPTALPKPTP